MGFAWKGLGPEVKQDGVAVAGPDTEFGAEPAATATPAQPVAPDDASPLSIGGAIRRKRGVAAGDDGVDSELPFIGHLSLTRQLRILLVVFGAGILVTILALWRNAASNEVASAQTQIASDALMHSQRIGKAAPNAVQGNVDAFKQLEESRALLTRDLNLLSRGGSFAGSTIPAAPGSKNKALAAVRTKWVSSDNAAGTILKMKPELTSFEVTFKQLDVLSPELLSMSEELLNQKLQGGSSARELAALGRMTMLTQRMARSSGEFLSSSGIRAETAFQLGRDTTTFRQIVDGFLNGSAPLQLAPIRDPAQRTQLEQIKAKFDTYQGLVASVLEDLPKFSAAKAAEQSIFFENEEVRKLLTDLQTSLRSDQDSANAWLVLLVLSAVFTLATAGAISRVMLQDSRNRTRGADRRREEAEAMRMMAQAKE